MLHIVRHIGGGAREYPFCVCKWLVYIYMQIAEYNGYVCVHVISYMCNPIQEKDSYVELWKQTTEELENTHRSDMVSFYVHV